MDTKNCKVLIIGGYSGAGKTLIIELLKKRFPGMFMTLPAYTTRPIRTNEKEGKQYFFKNLEFFKKIKSNKNYQNFTKARGHWYWINKNQIESEIQKNSKYVYIICASQKEECEYYKNLFPNSKQIWISAPNEDIVRRLSKRGTSEMKASILHNATLKNNSTNKIDLWVINRDGQINKAVKQIKDFIDKTHLNNTAIVTICNCSFEALLPIWIKSIRNLTEIPIFVIVPGATLIKKYDKYEQVHITATNSNGNPFSINSYEYVCAEKLRIFEHIPQNINRVLFIDLDVFVLNNFWARHDYFKKCDRFLIITPDISVGYKEKLNDEFKQFDSNFAIKHFPNGNYYYFNTGVFFASRKKHSQFFHNVLDTWNKFFKFSGKHPSIFDQNVFNYCLNKSPIPVITMPLQNNCLRQYCVSNIDGKIYLDKKIVMAMHFNGGDRVSIKLKRWKEFEKNVHFQKHEK